MTLLNELLVRSGRGEIKAFQQLYEKASPNLLAICKYILRDTSLAEDVLQEGFIKIWKLVVSGSTWSGVQYCGQCLYLAPANWRWITR